MIDNFSRTLSLLRREKKLSQREVSKKLGISQALLSHYENGQREPGLSFVVRAADYYSVSCDYLLGRSMSKDGSAITADQILDISSTKDNVLKGSISAMLHKKLVVNSAAVIMDLASGTGSRNLPICLSSYFSLIFYKAFRYIYGSNEQNNKDIFSITEDKFDFLCDSEIKMAELKIKTCARGGGGFGLETEVIKNISLSPEDISAKFPGLSQSLLSMLQTVSENLEKKF